MSKWDGQEVTAWKKVEMVVGVEVPAARTHLGVYARAVSDESARDGGAVQAVTGDDQEHTLSGRRRGRADGGGDEDKCAQYAVCANNAGRPHAAPGAIQVGAVRACLQACQARTATARRNDSACLHARSVVEQHAERPCAWPGTAGNTHVRTLKRRTVRPTWRASPCSRC